jgi:hypothetical protein
MSYSVTPAPARDDLDGAPPRTPSGMGPRGVRLAGGVLAAGTVVWATVSGIYGFNTKSDVGVVLEDLGGLAFQAGVMGLLHVQLATRATGVKTINRRMLQVERVLLSVAMLWSVAHAALPAQRDAVWMGILDAFWPLSMLGMFLIGIKVAIKGRWRGPARAWSLVAETWAVATIPVIAIAGQSAGDVAGVVHLLLGYTVLGLILAARPDLVADRG